MGKMRFRGEVDCSRRCFDDLALYLVRPLVYFQTPGFAVGALPGGGCRNEPYDREVRGSQNAGGADAANLGAPETSGLG